MRETLVFLGFSADYWILGIRGSFPMVSGRQQFADVQTPWFYPGIVFLSFILKVLIINELGNFFDRTFQILQ